MPEHAVQPQCNHMRLADLPSLHAGRLQHSSELPQLNTATVLLSCMLPIHCCDGSTLTTEPLNFTLLLNGSSVMLAAMSQRW